MGVGVGVGVGVRRGCDSALGCAACCVEFLFHGILQHLREDREARNGSVCPAGYWVLNSVSGMFYKFC